MDDTLKEKIEQMRKALHEMVDRELDDLQHRLEFGTPTPRENVYMTLPLTSMPAYFKGKKPVSVIYPDGTEVATNTWLKVAYALLSHCAEDKNAFDNLLIIQNRVFGRDRVIFASTAEGMSRPIEFYPGMFFEGKFDTEYLIKMITTKIFDPVGYDYRYIGIKVIDPVIEQCIHENNDPSIQAEEQECPLDMTMGGL